MPCIYSLAKLAKKRGDMHSEGMLYGSELNMPASSGIDVVARVTGVGFV